MLEMNVRGDVEEARRYLYGIERRAIPKAASRSLNRVASRVNTIARRRIAKQIGIQQKKIKGGFKIQKASWRRLVASVTGSGKPIPAIRFKGTRQLKKGVKSEAFGGGTIKGAFIATMPSGRRGVFIRKTRKRLPIRQTYGPSVPNAMVTDEVERAMDSTANETWRREWPRNLRFYLQREERRAKR